MAVPLPTSEPDGEQGPQAAAGFEPSIVAHAFGAQRLSSYTIALEAWRRGLDVSFCSSNGVQAEITDGHRSVLFNGSRSSETSREAIALVEDKNQTIDHLRRASVPVPKSKLLKTEETTTADLVRVAEADYRWPVVLKPASGSQGRGVFVNITTEEELRECYEHLVNEKNTRRVLLEEHVSGDDYRIYVVGEKVAGACRRIPAFVTGDGQKTIRELIRGKNSRRRRNPFLSKGLIRPDLEINNMLKRQALKYDSIPEEGRHVQLRQKANASAGGDVEDVTDVLPREIKRAAVAAVRAIPGLAAGGVDVLYDSTLPERLNFVVIELNARAHIGVNMYPTQGRGQAVPQAIVDHFFPDSPPASGETVKTLAMNFDELLKPLVTGSAHCVQAARIPGHGFPHRQLVSLTGLVAITPRQRRLITAASRRFDVSGALHTHADPPNLIVAGTEEAVEQFISRSEAILGVKSTAPKEWTGTVYQGFYFAATPLLTEGASAK